jgi:hypothetical protein
MLNVNELLSTLDGQLFPFNASEDDGTDGDKLKAHSKLATLLWKNLLASCDFSPLPSNVSNPTQPSTQAAQSPLRGERLGLEATRETHRIRLIAHSAAGASTGVTFFNENLELQTQMVLVQSTITVEATILSIAAMHGLSTVGADGTPLTLEQLVELIPPVESAALSKGLADNVRELRRRTKYLFDSVKLATRVPGLNGYHALQVRPGAGAPLALGSGGACLRPFTRLQDYLLRASRGSSRSTQEERPRLHMPGFGSS